MTTHVFNKASGILTKEEVGIVCKALKNDHLRLLCLRECTMGRKDLERILKLVGPCRSLHQLTLNIGIVTSMRLVELLAHCVQTNKSLTGLHIHGSDLGDVGMNILGHALSKHPGIVSLDIGNCQLSDLSIDVLYSLLLPTGNKPGLTELTLSDNPRISALGWAQFAICLANCSSLRWLFLDYNPLGDYGASCILVSLSASQSVQVLDLEGCGLTEHTGQVLLHLVQNHLGGLCRVKLSNNRIRASTLEAIRKHISENHLDTCSVSTVSVDDLFSPHETKTCTCLADLFMISVSWRSALGMKESSINHPSEACLILGDEGSSAHISQTVITQASKNDKSVFSSTSSSSSNTDSSSSHDSSSEDGKKKRHDLEQHKLKRKEKDRKKEKSEAELCTDKDNKKESKKKMGKQSKTEITNEKLINDVKGNCGNQRRDQSKVQQDKHGSFSALKEEEEDMKKIDDHGKHKHSKNVKMDTQKHHPKDSIGVSYHITCKDIYTENSFFEDDIRDKDEDKQKFKHTKKDDGRSKSKSQIYQHVEKHNPDKNIIRNAQKMCTDDGTQDMSGHGPDRQLTISATSCQPKYEKDQSCNNSDISGDELSEVSVFYT